MKIGVQAVAALAVVSSTAAFCPTPMAKQSHTTMEMINGKDIEKAAFSLTAASVIAVSAFNGFVPPADAAVKSQPAPAVPLTKTEQRAADKAAAEKAKADAAAKAAAEAEKALSKEEKERNASKKDLVSAETALKNYEKALSTAKATESKTASQLKAQQKIVDNAKAQFITASDKLSAAKNQKMPQSAVTELSAAVSEYI